MPSTVEGWFALLQDNRLLGLTELTGLQIPMFALLVPVFLAVHVALRPANPALSLVGAAFGLMGIGVYLASNTALSMLTLSEQRAAAASEYACAPRIDFRRARRVQRDQLRTQRKA